MGVKKKNRLAIILRKWRGDRTVRDAARLLRTSAATVSRIERGHLPDLKTYVRLCERMDITPIDAWVMALYLVTPRLR